MPLKTKEKIGMYDVDKMRPDESVGIIARIVNRFKETFFIYIDKGKKYNLEEWEHIVATMNAESFQQGGEVVDEFTK